MTPITCSIVCERAVPRCGLTTCTTSRNVFIIRVVRSYMHMFTRSGESKEEGQMLMKMTARSGEYALCVRYKCAGVGLDTDKWRAALTDGQERRTRHRAILAALRDCLLSPQGALTATMLPHLTGLRGAIVARTHAGRAPLYSPLQEDFVERLSALSNEACSSIHLRRSTHLMSTCMR